jgi:molybdenum cofactor synthesis domain-containing protein
MPSAAVVIIGNEILTGKFADENGPFLIQRLRQLGCTLRRLVVVDDRLDDIAEEVARCAALADWVVTTGGVGPTHDDLTFAGVAQAFQLPLVENDEVLALLREYGIPLDAANRRMAALPAGARLVRRPPSVFPVTLVRNVFVLPGVPKLVRSKFELIAPYFEGAPVYVGRVAASCPESAFAEELTSLAARFPEVSIGSYPRSGPAEPAVLLTLESRDPSALAEATAAVEALLGPDRLDPRHRG